MMSVLQKKPYIYSFCNEVQTCITVVNHHKRQCKYFTTEEYKVSIEAVNEIAQSHIASLHEEHGEHYFNELCQWRDSATNSEFFLLKLDAPYSADPNTFLKFSSPSSLSSRFDNTPLLQVITNNLWTVKENANKSKFICTYSINPCNQVNRLLDILVDDTQSVLVSMDEAFDLREDKFKIVDRQLYTKAHRIAQQSIVSILSIIERLHKQDNQTQHVEEKKEMITWSEIEKSIDIFREDPLFTRVRNEHTNIKTILEDNKLRIMVKAFCGTIIATRSLTMNIHKSATPEDIEICKSIYLDTVAAKAYILHTKSKCNRIQTVPDFISKKIEPVAIDWDYFIHSNDSGFTLYVIYVHNYVLEKYTLKKRLKASLVTSAIKLLSLGFFIFKDWDRYCVYDNTFLEGIYIHQGEEDINIPSLLKE